MKYINALFVILGLAQTSQAQQANLWGTGYWAGQQGCSTQQSQGQQAGFQIAGPSAMTDADEGGIPNERSMQNQSTSKTKEKKIQISKFEIEKKLLESKQELLTKKIERFFDSEVSDFLLQTHFEKMNKCDDYKTYPQHQCTGPDISKETKALCEGKDDVPEKLKNKWTTDSGGYCNATSNSSRGNVQSSICSDTTLRPSDAPKYRTYSTSECSNALSEYRKSKIKQDQLQAKLEKAQDEISDLELASSEEKLTSRGSRQNKTEGGCDQCALAGRDGQVQKSNHDWWSTAANVVGGLGLVWYGKKIDESAQAYNAQLGYPSTTSYGYPFVNAGVSTLISGLVGSNGNCSSGIASRNGIGSYGGLNGGYAASNSYSAFGYPQNYTGAYTGGGMYNSSYNYNGLLNSGLNNYGTSAYNTNYYNGLNGYAGYGNNYGNSYASSYSSVYQMQQQLQAYNQIPVSQQTPDIQVMIAQLQARINSMSSSSYNSTSNYGLNSSVYGSSLYYPSSATSYSTSVSSGR